MHICTFSVPQIVRKGHIIRKSENIHVCLCSNHSMICANKSRFLLSTLRGLTTTKVKEVESKPNKKYQAKSEQESYCISNHGLFSHFSIFLRELSSSGLIVLKSIVLLSGP